MSKPQPVVALSTIVLEYIALSDGARELIKVLNLLFDLCYNIVMSPYRILCDNNKAILASGHISNHSRVRHIYLRYYKISEWTKDAIVKVERVNTGEDIIDAMNKAIRPPALESFRKSNNVIPDPELRYHCI